MLKNFIPQGLRQAHREIRQLRGWKKRGYLDHAPQMVKENVFMRHGIPGAQWVETGTFMGNTTNFLAQRFPSVYSVEPAKELYENALKRFRGELVSTLEE